MLWHSLSLKIFESDADKKPKQHKNKLKPTRPCRARFSALSVLFEKCIVLSYHHHKIIKRLYAILLKNLVTVITHVKFHLG